LYTAIPTSIFDLQLYAMKALLKLFICPEPLGIYIS
jgi:hypothetical protein